MIEKEFKITPVAYKFFAVGDVIRFRADEPLTVVKIQGSTLTVRRGPSERQETLSRLTGREPEDFIP